MTHGHRPLGGDGLPSPCPWGAGGHCGAGDCGLVWPRLCHLPRPCQREGIGKQCPADTGTRARTWDASRVMMEPEVGRAKRGPVSSQETQNPSSRGRGRVCWGLGTCRAALPAWVRLRAGAAFTARAEQVCVCSFPRLREIKRLEPERPRAGAAPKPPAQWPPVALCAGGHLPGCFPQCCRVRQRVDVEAALRTCCFLLACCPKHEHIRTALAGAGRNRGAIGFGHRINRMLWPAAPPGSRLLLRVPLQLQPAGPAGGHQSCHRELGF